MYVIAGLGNPGKKYENTRHNAGFDTIDFLADRCGIRVTENAFRGLLGKGVISGEKVILVKPQTFMNLSGECVGPLLNYYKVEPSHFIVIYDDISLDPGMIRVRGKGSAGGHNGMKSLIQHLGTQEFPRVRIGTGAKPPQMDLADYVLGHYSAEDEPKMAAAFRDGGEAAVMLMTDGLEAAMNHFNGAAREDNSAKNGKHPRRGEENGKQE